MRTEYIKKLAEMMDCDAMLISPSEELRFFTGFSPMMCERFQALFVKKSGECFYLCNTLYADEVAEGLRSISARFTIGTTTREWIRPMRY